MPVAAEAAPVPLACEPLLLLPPPLEAADETRLLFPGATFFWGNSIKYVREFHRVFPLLLGYTHCLSRRIFANDDDYYYYHLAKEPDGIPRGGCVKTAMRIFFELCQFSPSENC